MLQPPHQVLVSCLADIAASTPVPQSSTTDETLDQLHLKPSVVGGVTTAARNTGSTIHRPALQPHLTQPHPASASLTQPPATASHPQFTTRSSACTPITPSTSRRLRLARTHSSFDYSQDHAARTTLITSQTGPTTCTDGLTSAGNPDAGQGGARASSLAASESSQTVRQ